MRELGDYLRHQQVTGYQPYFSVKDRAEDPDTTPVSTVADKEQAC